jgi:hypothetical protein
MRDGKGVKQLLHDLLPTYNYVCNHFLLSLLDDAGEMIIKADDLLKKLWLKNIDVQWGIQSCDNTLILIQVDSKSWAADKSRACFAQPWSHLSTPPQKKMLSEEAPSRPHNFHPHNARARVQLFSRFYNFYDFIYYFYNFMIIYK